MKFKHLIIASIVAFATVLFYPTAGFASILGSADKFAVLAGSTVTNTGSSSVTGDIGVWAGSAITGYGDITHTGALHLGDAVAQTAQGDLTTAFNGLAGMPVNTILTGQDLGGLTLAPGVYKYSSSAQLTGNLYLDAQGFNNAYWVFQVGSALTTASSSAVHMINPGSNNGLDNGVFWQIGTSATLGSGTAFAGNILADQSITLDTGASIANGRALARIAAVTMDTNRVGTGLSGGLFFDKTGSIQSIGLSKGNIVVTPEPVSMILFGIGGAAMAAFGRQKKASA